MKVHAALMLALVFSGVLYLNSQTAKKTTLTDQTGQRPASGSETKAPSLEETLKWLSNVIETSTGATAVDPDKSEQSIHTKLQVGEGCEVQLERSWRNVWHNKVDGSAESNANSYTVQLSLADIDPQLIAVHIPDHDDPRVLSVWLLARNGEKIIRETYKADRTQKVSGTEVSYFADRRTAEHVAEALRRVVLLCANSKHL